MKSISFIFYILLLSILTKAQKVLSYKMLDEKGAIVNSSKKAYSFEKLEKINDTLFTKVTYIFNGPCIKMESYKDATTYQKNGLFIWYDPKGIVDSLKFFLNNNTVYNFTCYNKDSSSFLSHPCTPNLEKLIVSPKTAIKTTLQNRLPEFKGDFLDFISNHFVFPQYSKIKDIVGEAHLAFMISEKGKVFFPILITSIEYNIDNEIIRVIKKSSGKWLPAIENYEITPSLHSQKFKIKR